ncbi:hypothetical protein AtNW77_Chr1g0000221 [Arabidopsis thaliana]|uniref:Uncharacterized protein n=1 Tax=Arabidopsis thaliana TaxID=3702 RepID=A0A178WBE2_ARATH|nr:hypothetical protein AXX17_AT1G00250 [Arabidopsis thaliana]
MGGRCELQCSVFSNAINLLSWVLPFYAHNTRQCSWVLPFYAHNTRQCSKYLELIGPYGP